MGWEISAETDMYDMGVRLAMRHQDYQMIAITNSVSAMHLHHMHDNRRYWENWEDGQLHFDVVRMSTMRGMVEYYHDNPYRGFRPIDAKPQFVEMETLVKHVASLNDLIVFAPCMAETKEIIVDEAEVSSILAQLIEAQKPEQERIRERKRLAESREGLRLGAEPRRQFHAQILSIAA